MNRNLQFVDSQNNDVSEEDLLLLEVSNFGEKDGFWNSNLGRHCKEKNVTQILIQMKNCSPFLKLEYTLKFMPSQEESTLNDVTFFRYLLSLSVNQTKKESVDVDLSQVLLLDIQNHQGLNVKVGEKFTLSKDQIDWPKIMKEEWIQKLQPKVHEIEVTTKTEGFYLKTIHRFKHVDGSYFTKKDAFCITEEEFNRCNDSDKAWYLEEDEQCSFPFKNHGENLLKTFLAMQK